MDRNRKLLLNTSASLLKQIVSTVCSFILPRQILLHFGNDVYGLTSSVTQFLGFISFLELGIGPVIQSNLYKPLAKRNITEISKVIKSANNFFRKLALIFCGYMIILSFVYPIFLNDSFDFIYTASLVIIISLSTLAEYYFGASYKILLNADQKSYISTSISIIAVILNTVISVILVKIGCSIHTVKLFSASIFVIKPLLISSYVKKIYCIDKNIKLEEEPIKQKWNGFAQHLASTVSSNIDTILLTTFSSLLNVAIYSVYNAVAYGITTIILTAASGLESYWGNMIANDEKETLHKSFEIIEYGLHGLNTIVFSIAAVMIVPFVNIYVSGVENSSAYNIPIFGMTLVFSYYVMCLRIPYFRMIKAGGNYKQTQNGSFISMALNVVISTVLVFKFGIMGVAAGTFIAYAFHMVYLAWYLRNNIICRPFASFIKMIASDIGCVAITCFVSSFLDIGVTNYMTWILKSAIVSVLSVLSVLLVSMVFHRDKIKGIFTLMKNFLYRRRRQKNHN